MSSLNHSNHFRLVSSVRGLADSTFSSLYYFRILIRTCSVFSSTATKSGRKSELFDLSGSRKLSLDKDRNDPHRNWSCCYGDLARALCRQRGNDCCYWILYHSDVLGQDHSATLQGMGGGSYRCSFDFLFYVLMRDQVLTATPLWVYSE
jgi:hypothetical protein